MFWASANINIAFALIRWANHRVDFSKSGLCHMEDFEVSGVLTLKCCLSLNPRGQSEKQRVVETSKYLLYKIYLTDLTLPMKTWYFLRRDLAV